MMRIVGELAVAIGGSLALSLIVKATLVSGGALLAAWIARRHRASVRHMLIATAFVVLLALPVASVLVPARSVSIPSGSSGPTLRVASLAPPPRTSLALSESAGGARPDIFSPTWAFPSASALLAVVWSAGVMILLVPIVAGLARMRSLLRDGLPWRDGQAMVTEIAVAEGIHTNVQLLLHEAVPGPMTYGVARPVIVLPPDAREWEAEELRRAIVHELEHIRRGDWLTMFMARTVCGLYWFHPVVWMLWRKLRLDAERACDDAVLRDVDPEVYADQLVTLAERLASSTTQSVLAMANRGDLAARVSAVLDDRQPRGRAGSLWLAMAAAAVVVLLVGVAPLRAVGRPQVDARTDGSRLTFEVASIKENRSGRFETFFYRYPTSGRLVVVNHPTKLLIQMAYELPDYRIVGGPRWLDDMRFDIQAKAIGPATNAQLTRMLRALLEDAFKLTMREEKREDQVLALVQVNPGRLGPNISPAAPEDARMFPVGLRGPGETQGSAATMADLAAHLSTRMRRPVVDKTGLTGIYNFTLQAGGGGPRRGGGPALPPDALPPQRDDLPALPTALQEQLGLRLESQRGVVSFYVIERVEQPTLDGFSTSAEPIAGEPPPR